ncbi:class A beta-lactamase-related serine hydrolase [Nocardia panacis]|uniref:Class A beta-lactamase-related serine hydrolase n=1 Tax=Nocardia panacis TaxID=2340916 RepID=A0A3A4KCP9_9NOCA|nr:class A beta-lactamase-related serine hydrolase [Nocardia panacis]
MAGTASGLLAATACQNPAPNSGAASVIEKILDSVLHAGFPGAQAVVSDPSATHTYTAGAAFPDDARIRIGSNTKTFVATVVLQLSTEGRVNLDAPIEQYLPGLIQGNGNDGNRITVRQLLQHTSGLPDYLGTADPAAHNRPEQVNPLADASRRRHYEPADLVRVAMTMPPRFEPGARSVYTNTNYIVLGMLIERVTGQTAAAAIEGRINEPLGLRNTYFPAAGEIGIRDPHPIGYQRIDGKTIDFTDLDPSWGGTAGAMISTGAELNRFFSALLSGKLLAADQLAQMQRTMPFDRSQTDGYGLGLIHHPSSCGKESWGHGGSIPGFQTANGRRSDGTALTFIVNQMPADEDQSKAFDKAFDELMCTA